MRQIKLGLLLIVFAAFPVLAASSQKTADVKHIPAGNIMVGNIGQISHVSGVNAADAIALASINNMYAKNEEDPKNKKKKKEQPAQQQPAPQAQPPAPHKQPPAAANPQNPGAPNQPQGQGPHGQQPVIPQPRPYGQPRAVPVQPAQPGNEGHHGQPGVIPGQPQHQGPQGPAGQPRVVPVQPEPPKHPGYYGQPGVVPGQPHYQGPQGPAGQPQGVAPGGQGGHENRPNPNVQVPRRPDNTPGNAPRVVIPRWQGQPNQGGAGGQNNNYRRPDHQMRYKPNEVRGSFKPVNIGNRRATDVNDYVRANIPRHGGYDHGGQGVPSGNTYVYNSTTVINNIYVEPVVQQNVYFGDYYGREIFTQPVFYGGPRLLFFSLFMPTGIYIGDADISFTFFLGDSMVYTAPAELIYTPYDNDDFYGWPSISYGIDFYLDPGLYTVLIQVGHGHRRHYTTTYLVIE